MDKLLLAIKEELQDKLVGFRKSDIYITPDLAFIPRGVKMPCIGIRDGKVKHTYGMSLSKDYELAVRLVMLVDLTKKEAALVDPEKGILHINKEVISILENNRQGLEGTDECRVADDPASQFFVTKSKELLQRKELGLLYTKIDG